MSKSSTAASSSKVPPVLPTKSAWSRGPPTNTASSSSSRSQSPAPSNAPTPVSATSTHSRRPSTLGGQAVPIKDGVSIPRNTVGSVRQASSPVTFGSIDDTSAPISSSPAATPTPAVKGDGVKSFGSIAAAAAHSHSPSVQLNGKPPGAAHASKPSVSNPIATSTTTTTTPAPAAKAAPATKPKFDVKSLFRSAGQPGAAGSSPAPTTTPLPSTDISASPSTRPSTLPPSHGPPGHPPNNQSGTFGRNGSPNGPGSGAPRSPVYPRQQQPTKPANNTTAPNGPPMSPSLSNRQASTPAPGLPANSPPPQMPGMQPGMPPNMQPGMQPWMYYPQMPPDQQQYMAPVNQYYPHPWYGYGMPPGQPGAAPMNGMSPRNAPIALQPQPSPGTPTLSPANMPHASPAHTPSASISSPPATPNANGRLNTAAPTFVPGGARPPAKVTIKQADGHEVDLNAFKMNRSPAPASPAKPPVQLGSPNRRSQVRLESVEDRTKRLAEEGKIKAEQDRLEREKKEKLRAEEEAREQKEKEEKEKQEKEEKAREQKLKDEEENRKRREAEEAAKVEAEKAAKEKAAEEERLRQKLAEEEKERQAQAEREAAAAAEAEAKAKSEAEEKAKAEAEAKSKEGPTPFPRSASPVEEEKEEGEITADEEKSKPSTSAPSAVPSDLPRRRPGPLDLSSTQKPMSQPLPSALATARIIDDLGTVSYPEGIKSPSVELNVNAKDGKFRYDRDFLMQFMAICKEKPDMLPPLEAIGLEPQDPASFQMTRGGSGRHRQASGASTPSRQASGSFGAGTGFGGKGSFSMGQFGTGVAGKLSSEDRFSMSSSGRSISTSSGFAGGRPSPMVRTASGGGHGSTRTRSKRGTQRPGNEKMGQQSSGGGYHANQAAAQAALNLEPVAPLQATENRWDRKAVGAIDANSPEIVDRKVKGLLNKLTMEKFDSISDQVIEWANKSENEKDGRTLIQVIRIVFEKATDEAPWSEMYARLCRKMMEQLSPKVQDDGIKNADGKPITGGQLFRKYLLNRCQEDFERGWVQKEVTAAAAKGKATEDEAAKAGSKEEGEAALYSDEYYAAQKAKRQGLGLIKFIGELFKLQMLTERIMHECVKKLLGNVDNPEEEEIESLCKLLSTVGNMLDNNKARAHMDVYFQRMKELTRSSHVSSRMQFMLQDVIELRERRWVTRNAVAAPTTIAEIREKAEKEKAAQDKESYNRTISMSRGGSRRGGNRGGDDGGQVGPDGWSNVTPRAPPKAGDLSKFGQISKGSGPMTFGPSSVFLKDKKAAGGPEPKREPMSRTSSNMFSMLSQGSEPTPDAAAAAEQSSTRRKLVLAPRSKPVEGEDQGDSAPGDEDDSKDAADPAELSDEEAKKKIDEDSKEFFSIRDLKEAEVYFTKLPSKFHGKLIDKLVSRAVESKEQDAKLVSDLFAQAKASNSTSEAAFEEGFSVIEFLDDIVVDAPKAVDLMALMMKGAGLSDDVKKSLCAKSEESGPKLLGLLSS